MCIGQAKGRRSDRVRTRRGLQAANFSDVYGYDSVIHVGARVTLPDWSMGQEPVL